MPKNNAIIMAIITTFVTTTTIKIIQAVSRHLDFKTHKTNRHSRRINEGLSASCESTTVKSVMAMRVLH